MPKFSRSSKRNLSTCHPDLIVLFNEVIKYFDCKVICGRRGKTAQNNAFIKGHSKVKYPNSKHNPDPSMAADVIPYPIEWENIKRMKFFAGFVLGTAQQLLNERMISHKVVSGLDWDADTELKDTTFVDHPHFQLKKIK